MARPARLLGIVLTAAMLAMLSVGVQAASATTYCVSKPSCMTGGGTDKGADLQAALTAAQGNAGADTVQIGSGTFTGAFSYAAGSAGNTVDVQGTDTSSTNLTVTGSGGQTVLSLSGAPNTVSNLSIHMPDANNDTGLALADGGTATGVNVDGPADSTNRAAVDLTDSTFKGGDASHPATINLGHTDQYGVKATGTSAIVDATINASSMFTYAVLSTGDLTMRRFTVYGEVLVSDGSPSLEDGLIRVPAGTNPPPTALSADAGDGNTVNLTARQLTVVGSGSTTNGIVLYSNDSSLSHATVRNTIIRGATHPLSAQGHTNIDIDWSDYDPAGNDFQDFTLGSPSISDGGHNLNVDPQFVDGSSDFRLKSSSPLIDAGDGASSGTSLTDLDGQPRTANGLGVANCPSPHTSGAEPCPDMGAYEYQPVNHAPSCADKSVQVAHNDPAAISLACSDPEALDTSTSSVVAGPAHGTLTSPDSAGSVTYTPTVGYHGSDSFTFKATDNHGAESATKTVTLDVAGNAPPDCSDKTVAIEHNRATEIALGCTDPDAGGQVASWSVVAAPGHGAATPPDSTGKVTYTPTSGYDGSDTFTFKATDNEGGESDTKTVTLNVAANSPPSCADKAVSVAHGTATQVSLGCTDPDSGDHVASWTLTTQPAHGAATTPDSNGAVTYTPAGGYVGSDSFTFSATDNEGGVSAGRTVTLEVAQPLSKAPVGPGATTVGGPAGKPGTLTVGRSASVSLLKDGKSFDSGLIAACSSPPGCTVAGSADTTVPTTTSAATASKKTRRKRTRRVRLGKVTFHLANGRRAPVVFTLTRRARKLLKAKRRLRLKVAVTITASGRPTVSAARTITLRAPRKKRKRH